MSGFSSSSSGSDGSREADTIDWEFELGETEPSMIFHNSLDMNDDDASMKEEENISMGVNAESIIEDLPMTEDRDAALGEDTDSQGRILLGGVWWNSSWAQN